MKDPQIVEAGNAVSANQEIVDSATTALNSNKAMIESIYSRKATASMELEMLNAREDLTLEMKYRKVELEGAIETSQANIDNLSRDTANHEHKISLASVGLNTAKMNYQKLVQPAIAGGNLSSYDIQYLEQAGSRSTMSHNRKAELVEKYGMDSYLKHVPMI